MTPCWEGRGFSQKWHCGTVVRGLHLEGTVTLQSQERTSKCLLEVNVRARVHPTSDEAPSVNAAATVVEVWLALGRLELPRTALQTMPSNVQNSSAARSATKPDSLVPRNSSTLLPLTFKQQQRHCAFKCHRG